MIKQFVFNKIFLGISLGITSLILVAPAKAVTLNGVVNKDTLTELDVSWSGGGLDNGDNDDALAIPNLVNWEILPDANNAITLTYLGGGAGWTGQVRVRHKTDPHPQLGENAGGQLATLSIAFNQLANTTDGSGAAPSHPPIHFDAYGLGYSYAIRPTDFLAVRLLGSHAVPEPFTILGAGTALGFGTFFKRRLSKKQKKNEI